MFLCLGAVLRGALAGFGRLSALIHSGFARLAAWLISVCLPWIALLFSALCGESIVSWWACLGLAFSSKPSALWLKINHQEEFAQKYALLIDFTPPLYQAFGDPSIRGGVDRGVVLATAKAENYEEPTVKLIIATIKPFKLEEVREALTEIGVRGMMVTEIKGFGAQSGHTEIYRGAEYAVNFVPKVKLEIVTDASMADQVVETITKAAKTGKIGDGKIFVLDVDQTVRAHR